MPILNASGMNTPQPTDEQRRTEGAGQPRSREQLYAQHFKAKVNEPARPGGFFEQVNGYGVQLFSQASSFRRS